MVVIAGVLKAKVGGVWVPIMGSGMTAEVARWNSAWGIVAKGTLNTGSTWLTTSAQNFQMGTPLAFTSIAGRRYQAFVRYRAVQPNSAGLLISITTSITASPGGSIADGYVTLAYTYESPTAFGLFDGDGVARTYTPYVSYGLPAGGTPTGPSVFSDGSSAFYIEDVGPAIYNPAPPPVNTPTPWTGVTFQNGWINTNGGYQTAQYRLVGDKVELRGRIQAGTLGVAIFNLPVGYRPPASTSFSTASVVAGNWAFGTVEVQPGGDLLAFPPGTNSGYILNGITFSTTA